MSPKFFLWMGEVREVALMIGFDVHVETTPTSITQKIMSTWDKEQVKALRNFYQLISPHLRATLWIPDREANPDCLLPTIRIPLD